MPTSGPNGSRRTGDVLQAASRFFQLGLQLRFEREVRLMTPDTRREALAWLGRPERIFWEILPTGGRRRLGS